MAIYNYIINKEDFIMANPNFPNNPEYNLYVGARYVPVFSDQNNGQWTNTISYEPLTIVLYQGDSYTSKTFVPIGTAITNSVYWVKTGDFNGQLSSLETTVNNLQTNVTSLNNDVSELSQDVNKNMGDIAALQADILTVRNKSVIIITDSYGTNTYSDNPFPVLLGQYLGYSQERYHYSAQNGAGFVNGRFLTQLQSLKAQIPNDPVVTDIYVCGGWNDESNRSGVSEESFIAAQNAFKTYAQTNYPQAELHLCFISWGYLNYDYSSLRTTRQWYFDSVTRGWTVHKNMQWVMRNKTLYNSELDHPNQNGATELAKNMYNVITTGDTDVTYSFHTPVTAVPEGTTGAPITTNYALNIFYVDEFMHNGVSTVKLNYINNNAALQYNDINTTLNGQIGFPMGSTTLNIVQPTQRNSVWFEGNCDIYVSGDPKPVKDCISNSYILNDIIYALPIYNPNTWNSSGDITGPRSIVLDTIMCGSAVTTVLLD